MNGPLGRREPPDWRHLQRFPLTALPAEDRPRNTPSVIGVNWYPEFDNPERGQDGRWRVKHPAPHSRPRGGHCVCVPAAPILDRAAWWRYYDQGSEGACVGFGCSRMMSQLNRRRYDARWLYRQAQLIDEWDDTPPGEGTSVRAGLEILRTRGGRRVRGSRVGDPDPGEGISAYRWATDVGTWLTALGRQNAWEVPWLNSWGEHGYPRVVWTPVETHVMLMRQSGEYGLVTDR